MDLSHVLDGPLRWRVTSSPVHPTDAYMVGALRSKQEVKDGKSYSRWGWKMPRREDETWRVIGAFVSELGLSSSWWCGGVPPADGLQESFVGALASIVGDDRFGTISAATLDLPGRPGLAELRALMGIEIVVGRIKGECTIDF